MSESVPNIPATCQKAVGIHLIKINRPAQSIWSIMQEHVAGDGYEPGRFQCQLPNGLYFTISDMSSDEWKDWERENNET